MERHPALNAYRIGSARFNRGPNNPVEQYMDLLMGRPRAEVVWHNDDMSPGGTCNDLARSVSGSA